MTHDDDFTADEFFEDRKEREAEAFRTAVPYPEAIACCEAAAYHEAGHAVVARVLEVPITLAYISFGSGRVMGFFGDAPLEKFSPADMILTYAGAVAEEKFSGRPSKGDQGDRRHIQYHLEEFHKSPAIGARLKARTIVLVDKHWPEITEVALELMRAGILRCDQIDAIMDYAPLLW